MECVFEGVRWGCGADRLLRGAVLYVGRYRSDFVGEVFSALGGMVLHDPRGVYKGGLVLEYGLDIRLDLLMRPELLMNSLYILVRALGMKLQYWMLVLPVLVGDVRREYDDPSLHVLYEVAGERAEETGGIEKAGYVELHRLLGMVVQNTDGRVLEPPAETVSLPSDESIVVRYSGCGPWARLVIPQLVFSLLLGDGAGQILMDGDPLLKGYDYILWSLGEHRVLVHSNRLDHRVIPFFNVVVAEQGLARLGEIYAYSADQSYPTRYVAWDGDALVGVEPAYSDGETPIEQGSSYPETLGSGAGSDYLELHRDIVARILGIISGYGELTADGVYIHMPGVERRLVYSLLERLWRDGYLRREVGRPRPVYRLTAKGVGLLREVEGDE